MPFFTALRQRVTSLGSRHNDGARTGASRKHADDEETSRSPDQSIDQPVEPARIARQVQRRRQNGDSRTSPSGAVAGSTRTAATSRMARATMTKNNNVSHSVFIILVTTPLEPTFRWRQWTISSASTKASILSSPSSTDAAADRASALQRELRRDGSPTVMT